MFCFPDSENTFLEMFILRNKLLSKWASVYFFVWNFFRCLTVTQNDNAIRLQRVRTICNYSGSKVQIVWLGGEKAALSWFCLFRRSFASPSAACGACIWFATDCGECSAPNPAVWVKLYWEDSHDRPIRDTSSPAFARGRRATCGLGVGVDSVACVYNKHGARRHQLYLDSAYSHM